MHLSGSVIKIAVSPDVPHDIIDDTFEGALIRRMVGVMRTKDGYALWSNAGVENAAVNLDELLELARGSGSPFATVAVPMLEKAIAEKEYLFLDEYGEALGIEQFDIAHVLQELCRMYPDRLTHFEVAWAEVTSSATPDFGRLGGGADFVTADAIESVNAKSWLDEKRQALRKAGDYRPGGSWEKVEGRDVWRAPVMHADWASIAADEPHDYFEVEKIEITLRGMEYKMSHSAVDTPRYFRDAKGAFEAAVDWHRQIAHDRRNKILQSMGLWPGEWALTDTVYLRAERIAPAGSEIAMVYSADDHVWTLMDGEQELGRAEEPQELLELLRESEAVFRN